MEQSDREALIRVEERTRSIDEKLNVVIAQIATNSDLGQRNALDISNTRRDLKWAGGILMALWGIGMAWVEGFFSR